MLKAIGLALCICLTGCPIKKRDPIVSPHVGKSANLVVTIRFTDACKELWP